MLSYNCEFAYIAFRQTVSRGGAGGSCREIPSLPRRVGSWFIRAYWNIFREIGVRSHSGARERRGRTRKSRDSPMCNCTSGVWSIGPFRNSCRT